MKTRDEMIYEFMLALAPSWENFVLHAVAFKRANGGGTEPEEDLWDCAAALADEYISHF